MLKILMAKVMDKGKELIHRLIFSNPVSAYLGRRFLYGRRGFETVRSKGSMEAAFLLRLDFRGKVVFDVGSYNGGHAQFFAASVGRTGYVVAFEPNPETHRQMMNRIGKTIAPNVFGVNMAVGLTQGTCKLCVPNHHFP